MSSESPYNPSSRAENGWLPSNTSSINERATTGGGSGNGQSEGASGLWAARGSEASAAPPAAARPTPPYTAAPAAPAHSAARPGREGGAHSARSWRPSWSPARSGAPPAACSPPVPSPGGRRRSRWSPARWSPDRTRSSIRPASRPSTSRWAPSVVAVQTAAPRPSSRGSRIPGGRRGARTGQPPARPLGEGTGFVVDTAGHIITNNHVVRGRLRQRPAQRRHRVKRQVVGRAPDSRSGPAQGRHAGGQGDGRPLGNSDAIEPGDLAGCYRDAVRPGSDLTAGIISAINRDFGQAAGRPQRG